MNKEIFPLIPQYNYTSAVQFKTDVSSFESGKEQRRARWSTPLKVFDINFEVLDWDDMHTLYDFYVARKGSYEEFYFDGLHNIPISSEIVSTPSGLTYSVTLTTPPIKPSTLTVTLSTSGLTLTDNGYGVLTGNGSGTINYDTGALSVVFNSPPGTTVLANYNFYYNCRFSEDSLSFEMFTWKLYAEKFVLLEMRL